MDEGTLKLVLLYGFSNVKGSIEGSVAVETRLRARAVEAGFLGFGCSDDIS